MKKIVYICDLCGEITDVNDDTVLYHLEDTEIDICANCVKEIQAGHFKKKRTKKRFVSPVKAHESKSTIEKLTQQTVDEFKEETINN